MSSKSSARRPLRIGIVANEFFDKDYTRMGGFGWAAKRAAEVLNSDPFFFPYFLSSKIVQDGKHNQLHGIPVEQITGNRIKRAFSLLSKKIDLFFTIDYRTSYNSVLNALPYLPVITWVRDPRSPEDVKKILTLKIPGDPNGIPKGISPIPTDELVQIKNRWPFHRKVILANKIPHMKEKNLDTYGLPGSDYILPNPSVLNYRKTSVEKNEEPLVVYLGRLDPIKRPWLFVDLARHFPGVRFLMMGKSHFTGDGAWNPVDVPENVTFLGHTDQKEKLEILSKAWILINTSIHEESPVSVFEALAMETPVVSYEDWGGIVKNFGISIGQFFDTGCEGMPLLIRAVKDLLSDTEKRKSLGKAGRAYVEETHNDEIFLKHFEIILKGIQK